MANYLPSQSYQIDLIFHALSDPTRRDILERLVNSDLKVSEIAGSYDFSLPTVSKHISVLEKASLVTKQKAGRESRISLEARTMQAAAMYFTFYKTFWRKQITSLESFLAKKSR